jgi:hypothetical protein
MASLKFWEWLTGLTTASLSGSEEIYVNSAGTSKKTTAQTIADLGDVKYALIANGVSNGDAHDHSGGDGAQIAYSGLSGLPTLGTAAASDIGDFDPAGTTSTHAALTEAHGISSFGATLVDDADAATARATLGLGTAATTAASAYATAAQGTLADSAVQPGDDAATLGSGAATSGYVLTADGVGGSAYAAGAGIPDGDKGDIIVSASGATWTVQDASITLAKIADIDADQIIGRSTAGTGSPEVVSCTAAGRSLIAGATASAQRTTLGLGSAAVLDVGSSANNIVQLNGSIQLPSVDGSQLTALPTGVLAHDGLTGLADDDHAQYHNDSRGDARYGKLPRVVTGTISSGEITIDCNNVGDVIVNLSLSEDVTAIYYTNIPTVCRVRWSITQSGGPYDIPQSAHPSGTVVESSYGIYQDDTITRILWETLDGGTSSFLECNAPLDLSLIQLDDLAAPGDNTDLNATASAHGLLPKLSGVSTQYLDGSGAWTTPAGGAGGGTDSGLVITEASSVGGAMTCAFTENTSF